MQQLNINIGVHIDAQLATTRQDIDRLILVFPDNNTVSRRWLRQFVNLVTQIHDVFACFAKRVTQFLVLGGLLGQLTLDFHQAFFKLAHPPRLIGLNFGEPKA